MLITLANMNILPIEEGFEMEREKNVAWPWPHIAVWGCIKV
jgi:hypothetical protein